jgi:hypothetical protein
MTSINHSFPSFHAFRSESSYVPPKKQTILGVIRQINSLPWTYRHHPIPPRAVIRSRTSPPTEFRLE